MRDEHVGTVGDRLVDGVENSVNSERNLRHRSLEVSGNEANSIPRFGTGSGPELFSRGDYVSDSSRHSFSLGGTRSALSVISLLTTDGGDARDQWRQESEAEGNEYA